MHAGEPEGPAAVTAPLPQRLADGLARAAAGLSVLLLVFMLALVTVAVAQRYLLGKPLTWADDLNGYLLVAFAALGAAEALRRGDHIALDLLAERLRPGGKRLLAIWSDLAVLAFAGVLAWSAVGHARFNYDFGAISNDQLELALWIPFVPLALGAALLALVAVARLLARALERGAQ
jgi:C4-dicarboxylate transporter DctQ subunit